MPELRTLSSNFTGNFIGFNGTHNLNISRQQFFKFATTMGTSHLSAVSPTTRLAFAMYRSMAVRCALDFTRPRLRMSDDYRLLETSEKSNISFWIGMTVAAIVADHVMTVPRLIHAKRAHGIVPLNPNSRQMADLVGQDSAQQWHVIEAKARQRTPTANNRQAWKDQARNIASIGGVAVSTTSYCYAMVDVTVSAVISDPPQGGGVDLRISEADFGANYYGPFMDFLGKDFLNVEREGRTFFMKQIAFDPVNRDYIYICLENHVFSAVARTGQIPDVEEVDTRDTYVAHDGVAVITSSGPCDL